jgi:hypothetical protein
MGLIETRNTGQRREADGITQRIHQAALDLPWESSEESFLVSSSSGTLNAGPNK